MDQNPKQCVVCTMPLITQEDYPEGADMTEVDWCKNCGAKDTIYPLEVAIKGMAAFIIESQGMTNEEATKAAEAMLKNSVAYKDGRLK